MKSSTIVAVGLPAAGAFYAGYEFDPGPSATLVVALVCGMAAVYSQLSGSEMLGRAQVLVDRGADESHEDGGQLFDEAQTLRERVRQLTFMVLLFGAMAPAFAALRAIITSHVVTGLAFAFAASALVLGCLVFFANRSLCEAVDRARVRLNEERQRIAARDARIEPDLEKLKAGPVFEGYSTSPQKGRMRPGRRL